MFYTTNLNNDNEVGSDNLDSESKSLSFLSDELVFKLTLIILMTIENLKSSKRLNLGLNTSNSKMATSIYFTSVAFALVFFSHIVNHTIIRLQESLLSMSRKNKPSLSVKKGDDDQDELDLEQTKEVSNANEKDANASSNNSKQEDGSKEKPSKKRLRLIYGQRRRKHNSDSDTNDEDESDHSDNDDSNSNSFNSSMYSEEDEEGIFLIPSKI